jgi:hypothetical protein
VEVVLGGEVAVGGGRAVSVGDDGERTGGEEGDAKEEGENEHEDKLIGSWQTQHTTQTRWNSSRIWLDKRGKEEWKESKRGRRETGSSIVWPNAFSSNVMGSKHAKQGIPPPTIEDEEEEVVEDGGEMGAGRWVIRGEEKDMQLLNVEELLPFNWEGELDGIDWMLLTLMPPKLLTEGELEGEARWLDAADREGGIEEELGMVGEGEEKTLLMCSNGGEVELGCCGGDAHKNDDWGEDVFIGVEAEDNGRRRLDAFEPRPERGALG